MPEDGEVGHNDQPGKPGRSTDLATEFPGNLRRYVREVRAAGAEAVRNFAAEMQVPLLVE